MKPISLRRRAGVGKSSILVRFADDAFTQSFIATIGYAPGTACGGL